MFKHAFLVMDYKIKLYIYVMMGLQVWKVVNFLLLKCLFLADEA